jgi:uncharacterized protein YcnI
MNRISTRLSLGAAFAGAVIALAPISADAHVTVHPNALPAGGFTVVNVRVPNERDKAATMKIDVKMPSGILFLSTMNQAGWKAKVKFHKLAKPVAVFGEQHTQEVDRVTWTATGAGIKPGQFIEFPLSIAVPSSKGRVLTFKALQTYSNGEVVRWIGAPSAEAPAPQVMITDKNDPLQDFPGGIDAIRLLGE